MTVSKMLPDWIIAKGSGTWRVIVHQPGKLEGREGLHINIADMALWYNPTARS